MKKILARLVRQSPPMMVAMLALFVAMGGTAIAAGNALITGKQIKNSSITGLDVKNKSLTPKDFKGSVRGARGAAGAAGPAGAKGDKGDKGDIGPAGPFPDGDIPADKTLRGTWALGAYTTIGEYVLTEISFGFRMPSAPTPRYINAGAVPPTQCPGTLTAPEAAPGNICVYEGFVSNATVRGYFGPHTTNGAFNATSRYGTGVYAQATATGHVQSWGTWAATSAAAPAPLAESAHASGVGD